MTYDPKSLLPNAPSQGGTGVHMLERIISRISNLDISAFLHYSVDKCPSFLLPYLAVAFSVDEWDATWSDAVKRKVIKDSFITHRSKGTVASIKKVAEPFGQIRINEGLTNLLCDGSFLCDGSNVCDGGVQLVAYCDGTFLCDGTVNCDSVVPNHWATYAVKLKLDSNNENRLTQGIYETLANKIKSTAPVSRHMMSLAVEQEVNESAKLGNKVYEIQLPHLTYDGRPHYPYQIYCDGSFLCDGSQSCGGMLANGRYTYGVVAPTGGTLCNGSVKCDGSIFCGPVKIHSDY